MTDAPIAQAAEDSFWSRVRIALDGLRTAQRQPAYGRAEIDRSEGSQGELLLAEALEAAWSDTGSLRLPLNLLLIELDRFADYCTAYGGEGAEECLARVQGIIAEALPRAADQCLRHGHGSFAVIMPGIGSMEARKVAIGISERLRKTALPHKESHAGQITAAMGLATVRPLGEWDASFLGHATDTLRRAQRKGMNRMMAIDLTPEAQRRRAA